MLRGVDERSGWMDGRLFFRSGEEGGGFWMGGVAELLVFSFFFPWTSFFCWRGEGGMDFRFLGFGFWVMGSGESKIERTFLIRWLGVSVVSWASIDTL